MSKVAIAIKDMGSWEFDDTSLTLKDAFAIKSATGLGVAPFLRGIADLDPDCVQTLVWLIRSRNEHGLKRADIDFKLADFEVVQLDDSDPTPASAIPSPDATGTSIPSPAGVA